MPGSTFNRYAPRLSPRLNTLYRAVRLYTSNGSAKAWLRPLKYLARRAAGQCVPPFFTIAVTYRCPCSCQHCGVANRSSDANREMDTQQVKSLIDAARRLGVLQMTFTGGDPLLREDLPELVQYAYKLGLLTRVNTSGVLLDAHRARELKRAGLTQCAVSIDDADPAVHDQLRGAEGIFEKAVAGMRYLKEAGILCQINTYAARRNVTEGLERIIQLGRELGVLAVYIILPTAIGRWANDFTQTLSEEEKARVRALQETTFVHMELPTTQTRCGIFQKGILFATPSGEVTPCPFVHFSFGNRRSLDIQEVWRLHCKHLPAIRSGDCPMNRPEDRAMLRRHVQNVAALLAHNA